MRAAATLALQDATPRSRGGAAVLARALAAQIPAGLGPSALPAEARHWQGGATAPDECLKLTLTASTPAARAADADALRNMCWEAFADEADSLPIAHVLCNALCADPREGVARVKRDAVRATLEAQRTRAAAAVVAAVGANDLWATGGGGPVVFAPDRGP